MGDYLDFASAAVAARWWSGIPAILFTVSVWLSAGRVAGAAMAVGCLAVLVFGFAWSLHRARDPRTTPSYLIAWAGLTRAFGFIGAALDDSVPQVPEEYTKRDVDTLADELAAAVERVQQAQPPRRVAGDVSDLLEVSKRIVVGLREIDTATSTNDRATANAKIYAVRQEAPTAFELINRVVKNQPSSRWAQKLIQRCGPTPFDRTATPNDSGRAAAAAPWWQANAFPLWVAAYALLNVVLWAGDVGMSRTQHNDLPPAPKIPSVAVFKFDAGSTKRLDLPARSGLYVYPDAARRSYLNSCTGELPMKACVCQFALVRRYIRYSRYVKLGGPDELTDPGNLSSELQHHAPPKSGATIAALACGE